MKGFKHEGFSVWNCAEFMSTSSLHELTKGLFWESVNFRYSKTNFLKEEKVRENSERKSLWNEIWYQNHIRHFLEALSEKVLDLIKCFATQIYRKEKNMKINCKCNIKVLFLRISEWVRFPKEPKPFHFNLFVPINYISICLKKSLVLRSIRIGIL